MRIRTIKPEFWTNEEVASLSPLARLLFIGLWNMADRRGRLEDRPRRIKVSVLPYDEVDVDDLLNSLRAGGFIERYTSEGVQVIQIVTFEKHQRITGKEAEAESKLPGKQLGNTGETTEKHPGAQEGRKGKEGKGREREGAADTGETPEAQVATASPTPTPIAEAFGGDGEPDKPRPRVAAGPKPPKLEGIPGTNKPTEASALAWFSFLSATTDERIAAGEVRESYRLFEASQDALGNWTWGRRTVGDWRPAMLQRILDTREKRGGRKPVQTAADAAIRAINGVRVSQEEIERD